MEKENHSSLLTPDSSLLINLPPRNDNEAEVFLSYDFQPGEINFDGQVFDFQAGLHSEVISRWLEESLLSVEISLSGAAKASCARCLKDTSLEISGDLRYLYYLRSASGDDGVIEEFADYMPVEIEYFGRVLDVMPQVEESIFSLLPTKVLCSEDCKGLCPDCGKNLNEGGCSCQNEMTDPRLDALRGFKI